LQDEVPTTDVCLRHYVFLSERAHSDLPSTSLAVVDITRPPEPVNYGAVVQFAVNGYNAISPSVASPVPGRSGGDVGVGLLPMSR